MEVDIQTIAWMFIGLLFLMMEWMNVDKSKNSRIRQADCDRIGAGEQAHSAEDGTRLPKLGTLATQSTESEQDGGVWSCECGGAE